MAETRQRAVVPFRSFPWLYSRALHELLLLDDGEGGWRDLSPVMAWRSRERQKTVAAALVLLPPSLPAELQTAPQ